MNSYLFIFDNGNVKTSNDYSDDDMQCVKDGYLDIIDITNPLVPRKMDFDNDENAYFKSVGKLEN